MRFFGILFRQRFNPLVIFQAALGIPAITVLIPSPACGRCRRWVGRRRFLRFGGMMIDLGSLVMVFICLFEVQGDNGVPFPKLDQVFPGANRFRHLNVNDFHHLVAKRQVLNVQRFKVQGASSFPLVLDFSQQIRHAIPHNTAACYVGVHV